MDVYIGRSATSASSSCPFDLRRLLAPLLRLSKKSLAVCRTLCLGHAHASALVRNSTT
jgi:hypothetical protein